MIVDLGLIYIEKEKQNLITQMLTDAGQYALRFGGSSHSSSPEHVSQPAALHGITVNPELEVINLF